MLSKRFVSYVSGATRLFQGDPRYKRNVELGFVLSLFLMTAIFVFSKKIARREVQQEVTLDTLVIETVDQTVQKTMVAAPSRPTVPIAAEDEEVSEDETMDIYDFDIFSETPPPPPPPAMDSNEIIFVAFSDPPSPVGGYAALHAQVEYPDIARLAGLEGTVILNVHILADGKIDEIRMLQSVNESLDAAAKKAIYKVKWLPAKQREDPVAVWFAVPIEFKLEE